MRRAVLVVLVTLSAAAHAELTERVTCKAAPDQAYALYVPTKYDAAKKWPIVYLLDARGRAMEPMERFRDAAEQLGFILASSYNSASDEATDPNIAAMRAMWTDTHGRFSIDTKRTYAAGFSGTVRSACNLAYAAPGSLRAIIGAGAGFPYDKRPTASTPFEFFGTVGTHDFNFDEMLEMEKWLHVSTLPYHIVEFDGAHEWMPPALALEALQWLVTRSGDPRFWDVDLERAQKATDVIDRERRYAAMVKDYAGIHDTSLVSARARIIEESKEYQDAVSARDAVIGAERMKLRAAQEILAVKPPYDAAKAIAALKIDELRARNDDSAKRILNTLSTQTGFYLPRQMHARGDYARELFFLSVAKAIHPESKYLDDQIAAAKAKIKPQ